MFEQKKPAEYKPKNKVKVGKVNMPKLENSEVVKNSDVIDDRPKELTTSLLSARAMFEGGNRVTDNSKIVKEVASWDGKGDNDVMSAKKVFDEADKVEEKDEEEKQVQVQEVQKIEETPVEEVAPVEETPAEEVVEESPVVEEVVEETPAPEEIVEEETPVETVAEEVLPETEIESPTPVRNVYKTF